MTLEDEKLYEKIRALEEKVPRGRLATYRKIGFYLLIVDCLVILFILYHIEHLYNLFLEASPRRRRVHVDFYYGSTIPVFYVQSIVFIYLIRNAIHILPDKDQIKNGMKRVLVPLFLVSLISLLFFDLLDQFVPRFPESEQSTIVFRYYFTYIFMFIYFVIRMIFSFNYFQFLYFKHSVRLSNSDFRIYFAIVGFAIIFVIETILHIK